MPFCFFFCFFSFYILFFKMYIRAFNISFGRERKNSKCSFIILVSFLIQPVCSFSPYMQLCVLPSFIFNIRYLIMRVTFTYTRERPTSLCLFFYLTLEECPHIRAFPPTCRLCDVVSKLDRHAFPGYLLILSKI